jgi:glycosyltransferase involved in cell wall biosynthesis
MKIHCMTLVKNEADIIGETLKKAQLWSDYIYVFDNGSDDGTWEIIHKLSCESDKIIPFKRSNSLYKRSLRRQIFINYLHNPRIFLSKIPTHYKAVWSAHFQYYFTEKDIKGCMGKDDHYDNSLPIEKRLRYYLNNSSELRFFRYDKKIVWDERCDFPYLGAIYPVRIWLKHYQYRSPIQILKRVNDRRIVAEKGSSFKHEKDNEWHKKRKLYDSKLRDEFKEYKLDERLKNRIVNSALLDFDNFDSKYILRENLMPKLPSRFPFIENRLIFLKKYYRYLKSLTP